ncbi:Pal1 cell morphology protein-domain-containing protein [Suillus spraguei]|nr:Pal1 cell morphology protein-domain-containing protein [Suillus spraguei]
MVPSPAKSLPHRDNTILEAVRDTVQVRSADQSSRTRMGRSQTYALDNAQGNPPPRPTYTGRRSLSQDSVLHTANALDKAKGKARGKKGSMHADVIDRLDFTGVGPMFHHDGPFDACAPSRNRHRTKAPMLAWSSAGADVALSNESPYPPHDAYKNAFSATYQAPKKKVDAIAEAWGIHEPEPYEEFFAGGGTGRRDGDTPSNSIYAGREGHGSRNGTPRHSLGRRSKDGRDPHDVYRVDDDVKQMQARDRERGGEREGRRTKRVGIPPPQPILVPEAQGTDYDSAPGSPSLSGVPKRTKSLMQRIRKMRDSPNVPMGFDESVEPPPNPDTYQSSRPTHRSQNSFLGRFSNGTGRPNTSPPSDEAYVYVDDPRRDKRLPATPYAPATTRTPSTEDRRGYFDGTSSSPPLGGLGRKTSLLKKVKDVVRGPK